MEWKHEEVDPIAQLRREIYKARSPRNALGATLLWLFESFFLRFTHLLRWQISEVLLDALTLRLFGDCRFWTN